MKLRIHDNSVRLRLSPREVALLAENGSIESSLDLGARRFLYRLVADPHSVTPVAELGGDLITVRLPKQQADVWCRSDEVATGGGGNVKVVVEKDLACRHKENDAEDTFPNPMARGAI